MLRKALIGKIHKAKVTGAELNYTGSIEIDKNLMDAANMVDGEYVEIYNITNGERLATYIIEGPPDSGNIVLNGAAARKVQPGDYVIIVNFGYFQPDEIPDHKSKIVLVDDNNSITEVR